MTELKVIIPLAASAVIMMLGIYSSIKLKERYSRSLTALIFCAAAWQMLIGIEQYFAIAEELSRAIVTSWICGVPAQLLPGILFLFVYRFVNKGRGSTAVYAVPLFCLLSGLLSPWGMKSYSIANGEYITVPGILFRIHMVIFFSTFIFSMGYLAWKRFISSDMERLDAVRADVFLAGFFLSFITGGIFGYLFMWFYARLIIAGAAPVIILAAALLARAYGREFVFISRKKAQATMPEYIKFEGEFSIERRKLFMDYGMYAEVMKSADGLIEDAMKKREILFPEDIRIPGASLKKFPLAVVKINEPGIYVFIQSKSDGIVRYSDAEIVKNIFINTPPEAPLAEE